MNREMADLMLGMAGSSAGVYLAHFYSNTLKPIWRVHSMTGIPLRELDVEKAKNLGISDENIIILNPKDFSSPKLFGETILYECKKRDIDFIGQYGWLVISLPHHAFP